MNVGTAKYGAPQLLGQPFASHRFKQPFDAQERDQHIDGAYQGDRPEGETDDVGGNRGKTNAFLDERA